MDTSSLFLLEQLTRDCCRGLPVDQMHRRLADASPDLLWVKDLEGCYLFTNLALRDILLMADGADEPLGKTDLFFADRQRQLHPQDDQWHTFGELCVDSDKVVLSERRSRRFDEYGNVRGRFLYLDVHKAPLWDEQGELAGTVGCGRVITREEAPRIGRLRLSEVFQAQQEELRHHAELLDTLLHSGSAGIGIVRDGTFVFANNGLARLSGYTLRDLHGLAWSALFASDIPAVAASSFPTETQLRRQDGSRLEVLVDTIARPTSCAAAGCSFTILDLSAFRRAEREKEESLRQLEQVFNVAVPLCLLSPACRLIRVNAAFCDYFGRSREDLSGRTGEDVWGCTACDTGDCLFRRLQQGAPRAYQEIDREVHGRRLLCTIHAVPFVNAAGHLDGMVLTFFDTSEQQRIMADLAAVQRQLIQADKLSGLGALSTSIAHEFNNPLCGIRSVLERFDRKAVGLEEDRQLVGLALEQCDRMQRLIRDLQLFHAPSSDTRQEFDLHRVIDAVLLLLGNHLKRKRISIRRGYAGSLPVTGVESQIRQAILNLVKNSSEAMPEAGGEIVITTQQEEGRVRMLLRDNGVGISADHLPHIFEPFFSTKPTVKGTGLGLSVAYGLIRGHQGDIQVESWPGAGATFTVTLPRDELVEGEEHVGKMHSDRR